MSSAAAVAVTTFLASAVEAIEMVAIVTGAGALRGWRSALLGAAAGLALLGGVVVVFGATLTALPIGVLRLGVGSVLLVFGLNWLRKGITRIAAHGLRGLQRAVDDGSDNDAPAGGRIDWTGFAISFKGVFLEGVEVAFIVVTFGSTSNQLGPATAGGVAAVVLLGAAGFVVQPAVRRIPRSALLLVVGVLLTSFGSFWSVEGMGISWPGEDGAIVWLAALYAGVAAVSIELLRGRLVRQRAMVGP